MSTSRPLARPKRPAGLDAAVRSGAGLPQSKKPKFDARNPSALAPDDPDYDEKDLFLELDEGAVGAGAGGRKRGKVELEGYESDSSEEGFEATRKAWKDDAAVNSNNGDAGNGGEDEDEDEDMFGDGDEGEEGGGGGAGPGKRKRKTALLDEEGKDAKKDTKFLSLDEIEGQEPAPHTAFSDAASPSSSSGDEAQTAAEIAEEGLDPEVGLGGLKKHAPKLDAFNMRAEMEEGRFDASGNFIRRAAEKDAVHDSWLEGVSRRDMKRAAEAREKRESELRAKMREDDAVTTADTLEALIGELEPAETVLEALARVGKRGKKKTVGSQHWRQKRKVGGGDEMDVDTKGKRKDPEDEAEAKRKELVERITGAADRLLTRGQSEVYEETRESLMRQYRRETGEDWVNPRRSENAEAEGDDVPADGAAADSAAAAATAAGDVRWEYRWTDGRDGGQVYGPYGSFEMKSWDEHGFFGEGVEFRKVGDREEEWSKVLQFD